MPAASHKQSIYITKERRISNLAQLAAELSQFATLSENKLLQRHNAVSEEDYAKDPTRNRLAVLLGRTNHMSCHLGQIALAPK